MNKRTKKTLSIDGALLRLRKYCAFTERSKEEVKRKLRIQPGTGRTRNNNGKASERGFYK